MAKDPEESDRRVVPQGHRKVVPTARGVRGGKATTDNQQAGQLSLFRETADSPKGADGETETDRSVAVTRAVPKSRKAKSQTLPAMTMTMEEVATEENLRRAFDRVASNNGAPGPDRQTVQEVSRYLDSVLRTLRRELLNGSYRPGDIRRVWIPKAGGGQRGLGIPNVIDRIVQQAVHQVLSPQYEPSFHRSSHGFRPGRSCHTAIAEAQKHLEEGYEWVVDIDLEKFFDRVNHDRLMARLEQRVTDERLLRLIRRMLTAKVVLPDGVVVSTEEGTPQGGPLSPLLSNIVLDELDVELTKRGHRFVRYADDCNIYVRSERAGQRIMDSLSRFIERRLRLKINREKSAVARPEERHFVGFRLYRAPIHGNIEVLLSERSLKRLDETIARRTPKRWGQSLDACIHQLNEYLRGWMAFFRICTEAERATFAATDAHIRRRLRNIVLQHWKRKSTIDRKLQHLGVKKWLTRRLYSGNHSTWYLTRSRPVRTGLRDDYFAKRGLVNLTEQWQSWRSRDIAPAQPSLALG